MSVIHRVLTAAVVLAALLIVPSPAHAQAEPCSALAPEKAVPL